MVYYNEWDSGAAAWLRKLIELGCIANGHVDERSITEVSPNDLKGYSQHHFFAGIGGWSYALRLSRWPDDIPVWTASLPCQPFSAAGKGLGNDDERHLLPSFLELIRQCKPDIIFGEQVERAIAHGWLDDLQTNMEAEAYAVGHCVLGAHSIGAPHIRQRLYWVADNDCQGRKEQPGGVDWMADTEIVIRQHQAELEWRPDIERRGAIGRMGNTEHDGRIASEIKGSTLQASEERGQEGQDIPVQSTGTGRPGSATDIPGCEERQGIDWVYCRDNKYRPIKSGIQPLVDGVPSGMVHSSDPFNTQEARTVRLKGYGNAIVPQVAAEFIKACMSCKR